MFGESLWDYKGIMMLYRQGFVSNSSSCSFCILGYILPEQTKRVDISRALKLDDNADWYDFKNENKNNFNILAPYDEHGHGSTYIIGVNVAFGSESELDTSTIKLTKALEQLQILPETFTKDLELQLISGSYSC